jgi:hypothetical protein
MQILLLHLPQIAAKVTHILKYLNHRLVRIHNPGETSIE